MCLLQPLAQSDEAALLERGQVAQVPLDVVSVQFVWNGRCVVLLTTERAWVASERLVCGRQGVLECFGARRQSRAISLITKVSNWSLRSDPDKHREVLRLLTYSPPPVISVLLRTG